MKVKLKLVAKDQQAKTKTVNGREEVERDADGNIIYDEPKEIKDAVQLHRLDDSLWAFGEFGDGIAGLILSDPLPKDFAKSVAFYDDMRTMAHSKGKEFEIDEDWIPLIKEKVRQKFSALIFIQVEKFLDMAVLEAKRKETDQKIKELKKK